ncbi:hypothetical protein CEUSTIGMA_g4500.t1 [Chlamydomonas eustigma]|uniref:DUF7148 domain-containing protein n=1 Tax=Chlamydomonas eustigma TaxID=1157962 RepID=A0A250X1T1_9CHLO|nr:hypothetical protein CEUSTIGMA_g4500.t1 [Chlamydomonas eustigma]|eukprot:GAX77054.1 hypothetical protein CEUSTIGMA_g4500.t1 [Chlamydomonas eustigma]
MKSANEAHIQLGTAALPRGTQLQPFIDSVYQWAATLSQSGANYPTALPLKVDKLENGFQISLLKRMGASGGFASAGDIQGIVEEVKEQAGARNVFFIRFYEGPASLTDRQVPPPKDATERLDSILSGLVDVQTIMQTMPNAIRAAVKLSANT